MIVGWLPSRPARIGQILASVQGFGYPGPWRSRARVFQPHLLTPPPRSGELFIMNSDELHSRIRQVLIQRLSLEGVVSEDIPADLPLVEHVALDSVDAIEIVVGLEREFGIVIGSETLDHAAFQSIASMGLLVRSRLTSGA